MLDPKEIDIEIARLEYAESSYPNYAKLANLYTIKNQMHRQESTVQDTYEYAASYAANEQIGDYGDSPFLAAIRGKDPMDVWLIMDDLMDTLSAVNVRAYDGVMRKIRSL